MTPFFLKSALRTIVKNSVHTSINVLGLALGFTCVALITTYIHSEYHFDRFHPKADRIYRVVMSEFSDGNEIQFATTPAPLAVPLLQGFPEFGRVARFYPVPSAVRFGTQKVYQEEAFAFADSTFFEIFSFRFLSGDPHSALRQPHSVVLTESSVSKLFGRDHDPIGQTIEVEGVPMRVAGVIEDVPTNSSLQFSMVATLSSLGQIMGPWVFESGRSWYFPPMYTFVEAKESVRFEAVTARMPAFVENLLGPDFNPKRSFAFQPLTAVHFSQAYTNESQPTTSPSYLVVLAFVALFVLLLACINFVNLTTAQLLTRCKETGMHKICGASRTRLVSQFLLEAVLLSTVALFFAWVCVELALPFFNRVMMVQGGMSVDWQIWSFMLAVALVVGMVSGLYPALKGTTESPIELLRHGRRNVESALSLKSAMVVFQFLISVTLIIVTLGVGRQMSHMLSNDLGFESEQVAILPLREEAVQRQYGVLLQEIESLPAVQSASVLSNLPWESGFYDFTTKISKDGLVAESNMQTLFVGYHLMGALNMRILQGRGFSEDFPTDLREAFIINEAAAQLLGLEDPVGARVEMYQTGPEPQIGTVVGVVENFHFQSMYRAVEPLIFAVVPQWYFTDYVVVRLDKGNKAEAVAALERIWAETSPERPFEISFMEDHLSSLYRNDLRMSTLLGMFSGLSIVIGCLGLFGIVLFGVTRRTKEIGVRKVLGASTLWITRMFTVDFLKLVMVANFFAWPLAYFILNQWMGQFADKAGIGIFEFLAGTCLSVLLAFLTVVWITYSKATTNPVEILRSE